MRGLMIMMVASACTMEFTEPPESITGVWNGSCEPGSTTYTKDIDVHLEIARGQSAVMRIGDASLREGKYTSCDYYAVSSCDVVLEGVLEGDIDTDLNYHNFSTFLWLSGSVLEFESTMTKENALFEAEFTCISHSLVRE